MKQHLLAAVVIVTVLGQGCSTMMTTTVLPANALPAGDQAVAYYLPKGVVTASVLKNETAPPVYRLSLSDVSYVPDMEKTLELRYDPSNCADDAVTVTVSATGLLAKVSTTSDDKTGAVVLKPAELGKEAAKGFALLAASAKETVVLQRLVDPLDEASVKALNDAIAKLAIPGDLELAVPTRVSARPPAGVYSGVAYRPLIPCEMIVGGNKTSIAVVAYVPDKSVVNTFPLDRRAFIKKVSKLSFTNGVLTEVTLNKPSEALGLISLPVDLAKTLVSIPGELLTVKVKQTRDEAALLLAQKAELDAQEALRKAQENR